MTFIATTPATNRNLTTLDNVRLSGSVPSTVEDDAVELMIRIGSAAVETYTGRVFARETGVETFRLTYSTVKLALERTPVVSIASIVEDGVTLTEDDYELDPNAGTLRRLTSDRYGCWAGKVVVTYTGGYLLPDDVGANLPADIEQAAILWVAQNNVITSTTTSSSSTDGSAGLIKQESYLNGLVSLTYADPAQAASGTTQVLGSARTAFESLLSRYVRLYA